VQLALLLPASLLAEATLSFAGLGFQDDVPSWGTLLQEAANIGALTSAPWVLAPAAAIFSVVLAVNLAAEGGNQAAGRWWTGSLPRSALRAVSAITCPRCRASRCSLSLIAS
jgi:peptide/nickel transport system permease protein